MTATTRPDLGIDWAIRCDTPSGCPEWFGCPDAGLAQVRAMAEAEGWSRSVTMEQLRDICPRHKSFTFTDDLRGLSRAEQIARVQAAARDHRDELSEAQAVIALSLYADLAAAGDRGPARAANQAADPQAGDR